MTSIPNRPEGRAGVVLGTVLIVLAFLCVAIMSAFGKAASDVPTAVVVFFQSGISLLLLLPWALRHGIGELGTARLPLHVVRALSGLLSQALFFLAVKEMQLVDAVLLVNAAPLFIPLVALLWLRTRITLVVAGGLLVGFAGVLLILRPSPAVLGDPAALLAVAAAFFSAVALVSVNRLSSTDKPDAILFYYFLISTVAAVPFAVYGWQTPRGSQWGYLAGIGIFMALAQLLIILAYQRATASRLAPFNYSVVVFSGIIGWLVWDNVPGLLAGVGILLVVAGGILSIVFGGSSGRGHPIGHGHWNVGEADSMNRTGIPYEMEPTPIDIEVAIHASNVVGESPIWCPRTNRLYLVDISGQKIHIFVPSNGTVRTFDLPDWVTSLSTRDKGGLVLTMRKTFAYFDPDTGTFEPLADPEPDRPANRFNDGKCDRQGRLWAGTMGASDWMAATGALYRFLPDRTITRMQDHVRCSNGTGWSPDSRTMYYTESFRYGIFAYDFDPATGEIANRRPFVTLDPGANGFPDGLTVDGEGFVWSAQPVYGRIVRYDPEGKMERIIALPVSRGTSCIFGGPDYRTLYITTATETLTAAEMAEEPLAGSVLRCEPGFQGIPETPFAG